MPQEANAAPKQIQDFQRLLAERQKQSRIVTKEESAGRESDIEIVKSASTFTVADIVKGLADLQLSFDRTIDGLANTLIAEASKLGQMRRAIEIETDHLQELAQIEVAARALDVLEQEQQHEVGAFEEQSSQQLAALEQEIADQREAWQREAREHELAVAAHEEDLSKTRSQAEADYAYDLERKRRIEADKLSAERRKQELDIAQADREKQAQWALREQVLEGHRKELETYRSLVDTYPAKLEQAMDQAREEAFQQASLEAQIQTDLLEKESAANRQVRELKIQTLQETIARQREQIQAISAELSERQRRAQDLASQAIGGTPRSVPSD
jgi:hypothetical protein